MSKASYARHRCPPKIFRHAVWPCLRFDPSLREAADPLAEPGLDIGDETVRRWAAKFGTAHARTLRGRRPVPDARLPTTRPA